MHCLHNYPRKFLAFLALSLSGRIFPGWEGRKGRFYLWRGFPLNSTLHAECNAWISCPPQNTLGLQSTQIKVCMSTTTKATTSTKKGKGKTRPQCLFPEAADQLPLCHQKRMVSGRIQLCPNRQSYSIYCMLECEFPANPLGFLRDCALSKSFRGASHLYNCSQLLSQSQLQKCTSVPLNLCAF